VKTAAINQSIIWICLVGATAAEAQWHWYDEAAFLFLEMQICTR